MPRHLGVIVASVVQVIALDSPREVVLLVGEGEVLGTIATLEALLVLGRLNFDHVAEASRLNVGATLQLAFELFPEGLSVSQSIIVAVEEALVLQRQ